MSAIFSPPPPPATGDRFPKGPVAIRDPNAAKLGLAGGLAAAFDVRPLSSAEWAPRADPPPPGNVRSVRDDGGMDAVLGEAIAVAGTLAGACIGVSGSVLISRRERQHNVNARMRDSFGVFLGAMYPAVAELRELPDISGVPAVDKAYNKLRGERAQYVATRRRERQIFGDGLRDRSHRVAIAVADLQVLPLPQEVRDAVDVSLDYLERLSKRRTPALKAEWSTIHTRLANAAEILRSR